MMRANLYVRESQSTPSQINSKKFTPTHFITKLSNAKDRKTWRGKGKMTYHSRIFNKINTCFKKLWKPESHGMTYSKSRNL